MKTALKFAPFLCAFFFLNVNLSLAQGSPNYDGGFKFQLNEDGSKYLRVISWVQGQAQYNFDETFDANGNENSNLNFSLRRARILMYSQIDKNFLILTHFGLNSLNSNSMSPTGQGDGSQIFFHGAWAQYNLGENHSIGGGLHYFNGISRLNNHSTLNMMTLDNHRQAWATLGLSDQFGRHVGIFAKGKFDRLQYRVAVNEASASSLDERTPDAGGAAVYNGRALLGSKKAGRTYGGYFDYQIFDQESNLLPYKVGTYLGEKKIFNIGAGFFMHPNGAVVDNGNISDPNLKGEDVFIYAVDAFYDAPLGEDGSAVSAYAIYQVADYGKDYLYSVYGTGNLLCAHLGYVFKGDLAKTRYQPYVSYGSHSYDAVDDNMKALGIGFNAYLSGHHSKLTLEYRNEVFGDVKTNTLTLQAMIYL
ncbi:MAG: hypothetical protein HKN00_05200 [Flavobacteriaceae bacterium]|nr:hypothetical protein [Flavobacteriaceae bacterium]